MVPCGAEPAEQAMAATRRSEEAWRFKFKGHSDVAWREEETSRRLKND